MSRFSLPPFLPDGLSEVYIPEHAGGHLSSLSTFVCHSLTFFLVSNGMGAADESSEAVKTVAFSWAQLLYYVSLIESFDCISPEVLSWRVARSPLWF